VTEVFRTMGAGAPMALPRRPSPLICRRLILVSSLAQSHGAPCINVLFGRTGEGTGMGPDESAGGLKCCWPTRSRSIRTLRSAFAEEPTFDRMGRPDFAPLTSS
jgi:hypothetical protein